MNPSLSPLTFASAPVSQPDSASLASRPRSRRLRILCADDNTLLGDILRAVFNQAGHTVESVNSGLEAWDTISRDLGYFDVLVTDHEMPGLNGLELVELLHQASFPGRIIVHTTGITNEQEHAYRRFGAAAIVVKSSRADALLEAVEVSGCP